MADFSSNSEMRKMGFIYETLDEGSEAMDGVPKNRTLLAANLTDLPATRPVMNYDCQTIDDVFEHYKPSVKAEFTTAEGGAVNEELNFDNLGDFSMKSMVQQSDYLRALEAQQRNYGTFAKRLQNNKILQRALNDQESKEAYLTVLRSLLQDLEKNG